MRQPIGSRDSSHRCRFRQRAKRADVSHRSTNPIGFWLLVMWSTGLALLLCAVGAAGIVFTVWTVVPTARATGFHPVQGRVIASKFQRAGKGHLHRPVIEYAYVVDGKTYENDAYGVGPLNDEGAEAWAFAIFQRHPVGARCTVYY